MKKIMTLLAYVAILVLSVSCKKAEGVEPQKTKSTTVKVVPSSDSTVFGTWFPNEQCRKDQLEKFVITNDTFFYYTNGFLPDRSLGQVCHKYQNLKSFVSDTVNLHLYFEIKNDRLFFYANVSKQGELIPGYLYLGLEKGLPFYLKSKDLLIYDTWTYSRSIVEKK